jgi:hypothetical protein
MRALADHRKGRVRALLDRLSGIAPAAGASIVRSRLFIKYVALFVAVVGSCAHRQRRIRRLVFLSGAEGVAGQNPARAGRSRRRQDRAIHHRDRKPGRLDHATALVGRHARATTLRRAAAVAAGARPSPNSPRSTRPVHEQLRVSRLAMEVVGSGNDVSKEPAFTEAVAHKVYYGPVYFRRESEPYMTLSLSGNAARHRREHRPGQPETHLGRAIEDQIRRAWTRLCGRRCRPSHRASRH